MRGSLLGMVVHFGAWAQTHGLTKRRWGNVRRKDLRPHTMSHRCCVSAERLVQLPSAGAADRLWLQGVEAGGCSVMRGSHLAIWVQF